MSFSNIFFLSLRSSMRAMTGAIDGTKGVNAMSSAPLDLLAFVANSVSKSFGFGGTANGSTAGCANGLIPGISSNGFAAGCGIACAEVTPTTPSCDTASSGATRDTNCCKNKLCPTTITASPLASNLMVSRKSTMRSSTSCVESESVSLVHHCPTASFASNVTPRLNNCDAECALINSATFCCARAMTPSPWAMPTVSRPPTPLISRMLCKQI
mmetsp:Transcript_525/g.1624  ORF Transcript_525/g.1624 Transcript_525/m.1624 type:complete len:213 (-) Transcript_525:1180-1818(-)